MKYVALVLAVALCACESRYGTYINIDGDANEIRFDHVELFWGNNPMMRPFGTPSGTRTGTVYTREFDMPSDEYDVPRNADTSLASESTYWLPVTDANRQLGYVGVLAFDTTQNRALVGVGELQDFSVEDNLVAKFDVELDKPPLLGLDVWGTAPGCFSWTKQREGDSALAPSTISVVLPDDADCDGRVANADCNDACPPDAPSCSQMDSVCAPSTSTCGLGCQKADPTCNPSVCLPPQACELQCALLPSTIDSRMSCYTNPNTGFAQHHLDLYIHKDTAGQLCTDTMQFSPYQRTCKNPIIEWFDASIDKWTYKITERTDGLCEIKMIKPVDGAFAGDHHILVSIDPLSAGAPRWTFLLGINNIDNTNCTPKYETGAERGELQGEPFDCP